MLRVRVAKWAGLEVVGSLPPEQMFIKLSLGISWAMLIKSSSMQTTVVQRIISNSTNQNISTIYNNINFYVAHSSLL